MTPCCRRARSQASDWTLVPVIAGTKFRSLGAGSDGAVLPRPRSDSGRLARSPDQRAPRTAHGHTGAPATTADRLAAVMEAYALIAHESRGHQDSALAAFLHQGQHVEHARQRLHRLFADLLREGAKTGEV